MKAELDILKISGETLSGRGMSGFDREHMNFIGQEIQTANREGHLFGVVVGGGNIIRGSELKDEVQLKDTLVADVCGMRATAINAAILQDVLENDFHVVTRVMIAWRDKDIGEEYVRRKAVKCVLQGEVVILAGGTGNPGCSTDAAAVLRAFEMRARRILKGTKVDGVYASDPVGHDPGTIHRFQDISYDEYLRRKLRILDTHAVDDAQDKGIPIRVFNIFEKGALADVLAGRGVFSDIGPDQAVVEDDCAPEITGRDLEMNDAH